MQRRQFLRSGALAWISLALPGKAADGESPVIGKTGAPVVISTWRFGVRANQTAYSSLVEGRSALDAVQSGVMLIEDDPEVTSVGIGGCPNADGVVQLDAAIMDGSSLEAGAVAAISKIRNPVAVARKVMQETPHVMLVGEGARRFALQHGFREEKLLTPKARTKWKDWKTAQRRSADDHDTIGMVALDGQGQMAGACTTSGLAWKLPGRVGDSPLIGHGMYCDGQVGGAAATGVGEDVIRVCGSYQVVEFMRQGLEPDEAIRRVLQRILRRPGANPEHQVGFIALRADGEVGYASTVPDFQVAVSREGRHDLFDAPSLVEGARQG